MNRQTKYINIYVHIYTYIEIYMQVHVCVYISTHMFIISSLWNFFHLCSFSLSLLPSSFLSPSFLPLSPLCFPSLYAVRFYKQEKIIVIVYLRISTKSQKYAPTQIKDSIKMNSIIQQLQQLPKQVIGRVWFDKLWSFSLNFEYQYQYQ